MIYLTTDMLDQAVYFDLPNDEPHWQGNQRIYSGLLGNGVHEVSVTLRKRRGGVDVSFGRSELFDFVEEDLVRRMVGEVVRGKTKH